MERERGKEANEALAGEVWPHTLLCGRRRRLRQLESWNNRTREREDEADERGGSGKEPENTRVAVEQRIAEQREKETTRTRSETEADSI